MPIQKNPTGLFPQAELDSSLTGYQLLKDGNSLTCQGDVVIIPVKDIETYLPNSDVLDKNHPDADFRYLLLGLNEVSNSMMTELPSSDRVANYTIVEGGLKSTPAGKVTKEITNKFWFTPSSFRLDDSDTWA
jgi:hypothetical protein